MNMTTVALGENRRKAATLVGSFSAPILARPREPFQHFERAP